MGLGSYCNDEVRKKENTGLQSEEERKEEEVYGVCQRMEESLSLGE